jgi:hypothetical protein
VPTPRGRALKLGVIPANGPSRTIFSASAQSFIRYNCNQTRSCIPAETPESKPDVEIREYCDHPGLTLKPNNTAVSSLSADQARILFSPKGYNCTSRSMGSRGTPAWEIQNFVFNRFWNADVTPQEFRDDVEFTYNNTAVNSEWPMNRTYQCYDLGTRSNPRLDGSKVQRCESGTRDLMQFSFDYDNKTLTLTQDWGCDASDRDHA